MIEILHEHPSLASLSYLEFERATKKNRLAVSVGDFMYSRLVLASRNIEPELNRRLSWGTGLRMLHVIRASPPGEEVARHTGGQQTL